MREKYAAFLPDVAHAPRPVPRDPVDVERAGGRPPRTSRRRLARRDARRCPGGLLGADYEVENGRYRFKKVFGGLNWTPDLRSPLTEPGVDVKAGEYLLAVEGARAALPGQPLRALRADRRPPRRDHGGTEPRRHGLAHGQGRARSRTSSRCATATGWRATCGKVTEATQGRVAYVYVPNTAELGPHLLQALLLPAGRPRGDHRGRAPQRRRQRGRLLHRHPAPARRSATGRCATAPTSRPRSPASTAPRSCSSTRPRARAATSCPGCSSKFELGPARRQAHLGRARRHPGLPGADGRRLGDRAQPRDLDRGRVRSSRTRAWRPDVEVEQTPADVIAGHDPQLEKAIELVMKELPKDAPPAGPASGLSRPRAQGPVGPGLLLQRSRSRGRIEALRPCGAACPAPSRRRERCGWR